MNTPNLVPKVKFIVGRGGLLLKKHSPDILFGLGVIGMVGSAVMASKASVNLTEVRTENAVSAMDERKRLNTLGLEQDSAEYKQAVGRKHISNSFSYVKMYAPAVSVGAASIAMLVVGHQTNKKRVASALAAYAIVERAYTQYRGRVVEKYGSETDNNFRFGKAENRSYSTLNEDGKKVKVKNRVWTLDDESSEYARFFDEFSVVWRNEPSLNLYFLKTQQAYFNDMLITRGHVFLNEVYDSLGIPRTKAGAVVGWVKREIDPLSGDGYIDFGLVSDLNAAFINGHEASVLIDPNVDGVIYDLL